MLVHGFEPARAQTAKPRENTTSSLSIDWIFRRTAVAVRREPDDFATAVFASAAK